MFKGQPKGLFPLALANTGERFGYYTMLAVFALFLKANFGLTAGQAGLIYSVFLGLVYFLPIIGGALADKFGFGKMVTIGIAVMFAGYLLLAVPLGSDALALVVMIAALLLISFGTGLFKGNLQVMVGDLYNDPEYAHKRDEGFSLFYMAINIGSLFAPLAAVGLKKWGESLGFANNDAYHFSFAAACLSLVVSILIYYGFRNSFRHVEGKRSKAEDSDKGSGKLPELSKEETKSRIVALCLVFAVVIFFWMAFQQSGLTLTFFADEFTKMETPGITGLPFNVLNLVFIILIVYAAFSLFQSESRKGKYISGGIIALCVGALIWQYTNLPAVTSYDAPIFQQFNPFFVVALTPVSMAIFSYLASKKREPSAPRKIAYGMIVAAAAYALMIFASIGLATPDAQKAAKDAGETLTLAGPYWLISTYLILTFGELLLSPIGISFVTKVAPPKYKGMMMGGWFAATAIGNLLVQVGGHLWGPLPLWVVWTVFVSLCLISAAFMFAMMKKLEAATK